MKPTVADSTMQKSPSSMLLLNSPDHTHIECVCICIVRKQFERDLSETGSYNIRVGSSNTLIAVFAYETQIIGCLNYSMIFFKQQM